MRLTDTLQRAIGGFGRGKTPLAGTASTGCIELGPGCSAAIDWVARSQLATDGVVFLLEAISAGAACIRKRCTNCA
jgi:hypothetical protein